MNVSLSHPLKEGSAQLPPIEVAVVTHYYGTHGGGIELVADKLIRELSLNEDMHFTWIASNCDPTPEIRGQNMLCMGCCNVFEKCFGIPWPLWGRKSVRVMREAVDKADIVWLHDTLYPGNIAAFRRARKKRKTIIITQHISPIPYRNPLLRWTMKMADKLLTARMLRDADEVVFISDRVAEDYYRRVAFTRAIKVIPNGVDIQMYYPAIPENRRFLRQQFALKKDQPVLLFVGRFVEKKGLETLRALAKRLPECRFWLAGNGPIRPEEWLLPNVHVFRGRTGGSLVELYQAADLLTIPSYGEGFPLVIQEAMACGLPVLCSPSTAEGCRMAIPYMHIADVWPDNPERTAAVWEERIRAFPIPLPLRASLEDLAAFACGSWSWPPIAAVYSDILRRLAGRETPPS